MHDISWTSLLSSISWNYHMYKYITVNQTVKKRRYWRTVTLYLELYSFSMLLAEHHARAWAEPHM